MSYLAQTQDQHQQTLKNISNLATSLLLKMTGQEIQTNYLATGINLVAGVGTALYLYLDNKQKQTKQANIIAAQKLTQEKIDRHLDSILNAGLNVIDSGLSPNDSQFLNKVIEQVPWYKGNCDAEIPNPQGSMLSGAYISIKSGKVVSVQPGVILPPNFETYWSVQCRNISDVWVQTYAELIRKGIQSKQRQGLLSNILKGNLFLGLTLGGAMGLIVIMMILNQMRAK